MWVNVGVCGCMWVYVGVCVWLYVHVGMWVCVCGHVYNCTSTCACSDKCMKHYPHCMKHYPHCMKHYPQAHPGYTPTHPSLNPHTVYQQYCIVGSSAVFVRQLPWQLPPHAMPVLLLLAKALLLIGVEMMMRLK